jgi:geranylgeranyl pyrophosphate synthase
LPGIDNDVLRRGQATCHVKFGEATAILAGDYLLNLAVENIGKLQTKSENKVALIKILTSCGRELLEGEMLDIIGESQPHSRELLEVTFLKKTGALFGACFALGGIMAGKILPRDYRWYQQLGNDLGLAFQIQDDVLGVMGDERKLGKSVGLDEEADKSTWVRAYGLEQAQIDYQKYYHRVRDGLSKLPDGEGKEFLGSLITYLQNRDH